MRYADAAVTAGLCRDHRALRLSKGGLGDGEYRVVAILNRSKDGAFSAAHSTVMTVARAGRLTRPE